MQQVPQKLIRNLTSSGPLYFSFPTPRSSILAFDKNISGKFILRYESGQLTEIITKKAGKKLRVAVFPGDIVLEEFGENKDNRVISVPEESAE